MVYGDLFIHAYLFYWYAFCLLSIPGNPDHDKQMDGWMMDEWMDGV